MIACDSCGEPIRDWEKGMVEFEGVPGAGRVRFYHKGTCDPGGEYWWEMTRYLVGIMSSVDALRRGEGIELQVKESIGW